MEKNHQALGGDSLPPFFAYLQILLKVYNVIRTRNRGISLARSNTMFRFKVSDEDFHSSFGWCGNRPKCVMVAIKPEGVAIRDSKDHTKATLFFTREEFLAFANGIKAGEFV